MPAACQRRDILVTMQSKARSFTDSGTNAGKGVEVHESAFVRSTRSNRKRNIYPTHVDKQKIVIPNPLLGKRAWAKTTGNRRKRDRCPRSRGKTRTGAHLRIYIRYFKCNLDRIWPLPALAVPNHLGQLQSAPRSGRGRVCAHVGIRRALELPNSLDTSLGNGLGCDQQACSGSTRC